MGLGATWGHPNAERQYTRGLGTRLTVGHWHNWQHNWDIQVVWLWGFVHYRIVLGLLDRVREYGRWHILHLALVDELHEPLDELGTASS